VHVTAAARALGGMQKEALVRFGPSGTCWRMLCDEGPYLNGTDLAPFPLAYFSTGVVTCYLSEILAQARHAGVPIDDIELIQDSRYGMEGSALLGTMIGSALPVELEVRVRSPVPRTELLHLTRQAIAASPPHALLATPLASEFTLTRNKVRLPVTMVTPWRAEAPTGFAALFEDRTPAASGDYAPDIITKLSAAEALRGVEGGAGSSLEAEQKRTLHLRAVCTLRADGLKQVTVRLFRPIGSVFRFLGDDAVCFGGGERAPDGLAYLSAGIAFCYMTQIGRYAHIVKQRIDSYGVIQHTRFSLPGASGGTGTAATAAPVRTHVFVDSPETEEKAQTLVKMAEQTCFLHAACRTPLETRVTVAEPANT
jgi:organic hydroperoxide reductase OsmC/OhrA